jgi:hypothetical protein
VKGEREWKSQEWERGEEGRKTEREGEDLPSSLERKDKREEGEERSSSLERDPTCRAAFRGALKQEP